MPCQMLVTQNVQLITQTPSNLAHVDGLLHDLDQPITDPNHTLWYYLLYKYTCFIYCIMVVQTL